MTRADAPRLFVALLLGMVAGVGMGWALPRGAGAAVRAQSADARAVVAQLYDDGSWAFVGATVVPTPTDAPSDTPEPTATGTPTVGRTPTPALPSPTPEATRPPVQTEAPSDKGCVLKVGASSIRERAQPSTTAAILDTVPPGSLVKFSAFVRGNNYLWGQTAFGWMVVGEWRGDSFEHWMYGVDLSETCADAEGWPQGLAPPAPIAALPGVWVGVGANRDELLSFGRSIQAAGTQPAAVVYGEPDTAALLRANGWHVAVRAASVPDCPEYGVSVAESAQRFTTRVVEAVGANWHAVILANECHWPNAEYAAAWVRAAGQQAAEMGVRALVPIVWNPGSPELAWVPVLADAYRDSPIAMLWGQNIYPAKSGVPLSTRDGFTAWTTYRWEMYRNQLRGVPMAITEYARGDGSEVPDFADIRAWWNQTAPSFAWGCAWYDAMPLGTWPSATLRGKLSQLALALR